MSDMSKESTTYVAVALAIACLTTPVAVQADEALRKEIDRRSGAAAYLLES
jgi:ABC-type sulfate transport system permease component